jgi:pimeloyl-ACP methyl ester carboxylesterase
MSHPAVPRGAVVLVHGLAAPRAVMSPLERHLKPWYASVTNWSYPSLWSRIERHGRALANFLRQLEGLHVGTAMHLVTHSMGGIVARLALAEYLPAQMGRLVMLAPPNGGSHVARRLAPLIGRLIPPVSQLSNDVRSFMASVPVPMGVHIGVIAAAKDVLVAEPLTHLPNEADHITLPGFHSSVLWKAETARQVAHFLEHGRFDRPHSTPRPAAA